MAADIELLRADINHLVQPVIGGLRLYENDPEMWQDLHRKQLSHTIGRLYAALKLMDEAVTGVELSIEERAKYGLGNNHYPTLSRNA